MYCLKGGVSINSIFYTQLSAGNSLHDDWKNQKHPTKLLRYRIEKIILAICLMLPLSLLFLLSFPPPFFFINFNVFSTLTSLSTLKSLYNLGSLANFSALLSEDTAVPSLSPTYSSIWNGIVVIKSSQNHPLQYYLAISDLLMISLSLK